MTHREYFLKHGVSIEQYGVLLVRLAFGGINTRHGNKGFDIAGATIGGIENCRIEVKSKITKGASVIHCNETKFIDNGMTHLAVVLIDQSDYQVEEAWLITSDEARKSIQAGIQSKIIYVKTMRLFGQEKQITSNLRKASEMNLCN